MAMTLDQIDKALADWQTRLTLASNNLMELDDLYAYKRLCGADTSTPRLTGITATQVTPALTAVRELWQYYQMLSDVVTRATEMRKNVPKLWGSQTTGVRELEQLLIGPSVQLPPVQTPLAQRGLLSTSETAQATTLDELLAAMTQAFQVARDALLAVDAAWRQLLPTLGACDQEAAKLQTQADALGVGTLAELTAARQQIARLRAAVESDPLGANADLDRQITPLLQRVHSLLDDLARQRDATTRDMQRAHELLATLQTLNTQCAQALDECRQKIASPTGLCAPLDASRLTDLSDWLDTLDATLQQGRWKAARVGLDRWLQTAGGLADAARAAYAANRAPLDTRAELRGRLSSLRAKAQAYTARGVALDTTLTQLAAAADQLLQQRPTPIDEAARLVTEYETRLARCLKSS
jgi:chromosome segregation ATPase